MPRSTKTRGAKKDKHDRSGGAGGFSWKDLASVVYLADALIDEPQLTTAGGHKKGDGPKGQPQRAQGRAQVTKKFSLVNRTQSAKTVPTPAAKAEETIVKAQSTAQNAGVVVGMPMGMNSSGLRPIARVEVMSQTQPITYQGSLGVASATVVCDPTGVATDALPVDAWNSRFAGFQQYRVRSTKWILTPIRTNVGTTTSSQGAGCVGIWVQDTPQVGGPTPTTFQQANRKLIPINTDKTEVLTYTTNEPQDLNLSDIFLPPTHITGATLQQGQHAFQLYGDTTLTGLAGYPGSGFTPIFCITAVYDIEFFGVGGV
jgi:hypothetical protein